MTGILSSTPWPPCSPHFIAVWGNKRYELSWTGVFVALSVYCEMGSWRYVYVVNGWMFFSDASILSHDLTLQVSWSASSNTSERNPNHIQGWGVSTSDGVFSLIRENAKQHFYLVCEVIPSCQCATSAATVQTSDNSPTVWWCCWITLADSPHSDPRRYVQSDDTGGT